MIPGSRPDQRYTKRVDRQTYLSVNCEFIRTLSETDASLYKIYWRTGSRFSALVGGSDLKVVDTSRAKTL